MLDMRTVLAITIAYSLFSGMGIIIFGSKRKIELGIISIGAVLINESEKNMQKFLEQADNLLYEAKSSGRNGVKR